MQMQTQTNHRPKTDWPPHTAGRWVMLAVGLSVMALGVAFSIRSNLGTSPVSSVPYTTSVISGLSVGTTTILVNAALVLLQIAILRSRFQWFQLLQLAAVTLFGGMIDVCSALIAGIQYHAYWQQLLLCVIGIVLVGFGVSIEVAARLVTNAGEGVVLSICQVAPVQFGNIKICFDVTLVLLAVVLSVVFLGTPFTGVREGTILAALGVGFVSKLTRKPVEAFEKAYLC